MSATTLDEAVSRLRVCQAEREAAETGLTVGEPSENAQQHAAKVSGANRHREAVIRRHREARRAAYRERGYAPGHLLGCICDDCEALDTTGAIKALREAGR